MLFVNIEYVHESARKPSQGTPGSAGWDVYTAAAETTIPAESTALVRLGFAVELPPGWAAYLYPRSSVAALGLLVSHPPIDADYRGELKVIVTNTRKEAVTVKVGERLAQLVFMPVPIVTWRVQQQLSLPAVAHAGFGSTGK